MLRTGIVWLVLVVGCCAAILPIVAEAQALDDTTIAVLALDCRGANVYDQSTCSPAEGVPFLWQDFSTNPVSTDVRYTAADGTDTISVTPDALHTFSYSTEIAWSETPVVPLYSERYAYMYPGDQITFKYLLVEPELALEGEAVFTLDVLDCSLGNPEDPSTCEQIPGLPFIYEIIGSGGSFSDIGHTNPSDGSYRSIVSVPATITISFTLDYIEFELIPVDPVQQILLLAGDDSTLIFIFVAEDEDPVTELPDTGTGMGQDSIDWDAWLLLSGVLTGCAGVVLRRRIRVLTY